MCSTNFELYNSIVYKRGAYVCKFRLVNPRSFCGVVVFAAPPLVDLGSALARHASIALIGYQGAAA